MATSVISYKSVAEVRETFTNKILAWHGDGGYKTNGQTLLLTMYDVPNLSYAQNVSLGIVSGVVPIGWFDNGTTNFWEPSYATFSGNLQQFTFSTDEWGLETDWVQFTLQSSTYNASTRQWQGTYLLTTGDSTFRVNKLYFSVSGYVTTSPAYIARYTYSLRYNGEVRIYKAVAVSDSTFANVDLVYKYDKSFDSGTTWVAQESGAYITK